MAPTKQEIIRQIQQGKVKTALEGIVQLSGLARDKEVQQRCVILQSQLSQLDSNFGMGTFDQKTYQMEYNRITQATLELVYMLPAVVEAPPQYRAQGSAYQPQPSSGSGWKTWGILLTGGIGVLVILMVVGLMMENNKQSSLGQVPDKQSLQASESDAESLKSEKLTAQQTNLESQAPSASLRTKLIGNWGGNVFFGSTNMGGVKTQFMANNQYVSQAYLESAGAVDEPDSGTWVITENGELLVTSVNGETYSYVMQWIDDRTFSANIKDVRTQQFTGVSVNFHKQ
ncbi:MAG TPA: hypothetical protein VK168_03195 [Saprospiraceae bacterium]|nr:hypothetical protein [Saprospiraceae bacterium]